MLFVPVCKLVFSLLYITRLVCLFEQNLMRRSIWQEINMQQEVDEAIKAIDNKLSSRSNQLMPDACCEKDKQKIKSCMLNTTSSEQCCPTFRAMIGVNCNCYNYAQDLDNQLLIVIESLCDVPNPCNKKAQVIDYSSFSFLILFISVYFIFSAKILLFFLEETLFSRFLTKK